jgi:hypothetical protein
MWLGEAIANWTGITTEGFKREAPFLTDADWGADQNVLWRRDDRIDFVFQDPWLADDDTDIEYVYLHLLQDRSNLLLSPQQLAQGWKEYINMFIWVSNAKARSLMEAGALPPVTGLGALNPDYLQIDAQLTTEIFGALAPGMPEQALHLADLPIRTTAGGSAAHAAQFHVLLYALASKVDDAASRRDQLIGLVREARRYLPNDSKTADVVDFVLEDYLTNRNPMAWERTRNRVYRRYQAGAGANGFVYRDWTESSVNLAAGLIALLYGQGDYRRTVQIGTLSGWDSDNGTATMGGLLGLLLGYDDIIAAFPARQLSDRYRISRTRPTLPDHLPEDGQAEDTFTMMAERMLPLVDQVVLAAGGSVEGDVWTLPVGGTAPPLHRNPLIELYLRSANNRVRLAGGAVTTQVSGEAVPSLTWVIADGLEHDYSGVEVFSLPQAYRKTFQGEPVTLTVTYDRPVEIASIRFIEGDTGGFADLEAAVLVDGEWQPVPEGTTVTPAPDATMPMQLFDIALPEPVQGTGIRLTGTAGGLTGTADETSRTLTVLELDALSASTDWE